MNYNLITILGPTAVGKTRLAAELALKYNGEVISADSRQVYKGMDIGTGKDLGDYKVDGESIKYHLINVVSANEEYDLFKFTQAFRNSFAKVKGNKKIPFLVGGTGMYLHSILKNYKLAKVNNSDNRLSELQKLSDDELKTILLSLNTQLHNTTDLLDRERIIQAILVAESNNLIVSENINSLTIGIRLERDIIKKRITERLKQRLDNGMIEEVEKLLSDGITHEKLRFFGLEYKFLSLYLNGELNYNDMFQKLNSAIHNFAKRQMTWFRKMEREGINIHWIDGPDFNAACFLIDKNFLGK